MNVRGRIAAEAAQGLDPRQNPDGDTGRETGDSVGDSAAAEGGATDDGLWRPEPDPPTRRRAAHADAVEAACFAFTTVPGDWDTGNGHIAA